MTRLTIIWGVIILGCTVQALFGTEADNTPDYSNREDNPPEYMSKEDREMLKEEARDMFYHAYNAYMDNAYPADELMPLSCKGRYRNSEPDRGDIDSTLGNFSLTLVDTLDTLVVLGDLGEFENAVRLVVKDVAFDTDVIVSLFETNIRMLGGLLSGHILAEYLQSRADIMPWYRGELLNLAKDLGYRFLPAFNTTTGIPFGRINLRNGMKGVPAEMCRETCTACAGSMILEMAALSRLTGEPVFEEKAQRAMDALWKMRHRGTDLMGSVLNVHSGDWVRRDSGVGAGIDSYYEYCLKAYILLGDEKYLGRFNKHYQAVMKYVSQGPMLLDVHMHRPNTNSKNFMDALLAFWPGLQVLKGDIKPAVETHEMLYQVMQRHNFIPEAFTTDFQVHWGHHPLRPEFLESTYFLYRATGDHYYLGVGRKVLKSLQTYARVACGYAAVSDVRTNKHDDTMDSFVLSETLKYLYLLFAEPNDLVLDLDEFIFTTEGHLLPLTLAAVRTNITSDLDRDIVEVDELDRTCPNSLHLFPASVRQPLRNMVEDVCPRRSVKRRLSASQFEANNLEHLKILSNMGITILTPAAGRVQVLHTFSNARSSQDAEEGLLFMQEMAELSKKQAEQSETRPQLVTYVRNDENPPREVTLLAGPAHFGPRLKDGKKITGTVAYANPFEACHELLEPENLVGKIVMVSRGNCMFVEKARRIQKTGAIAGIIFDNVAQSSAAESPMFAMSGDGKDPDDVTIPLVFLFTREAAELVVAHVADNSMVVTIGDYTLRDEIQLNAPGDLSVFERLKGSLKDFLTRQVMPENSPSRPTVTTPEVFRIDGLHLPFEFKISDCHLKAVIRDKSGSVKIVRSEWPTPIHKERKFFNKMEKGWHEIKQKLVNSIYSLNDMEIAIPLPKIRFQYIFVHKFRGLEKLASSTVSISSMVEWFLEEFKDISPEETDVKIDENSHGKPGETVINDFSENPSSGVARETSTETKNSPNGQDVPSMQSHFEKIVDQMNFEISLDDFEFEFIDFRTSLLTEVHKSSVENSESGALVGSRDVEKSNDGDSSTTTTTTTQKYFRAWLDREKNVVNVKLVKTFDLSIGNIADIWKLDKYERIWYNLRQFLVNLIYCYDRETIKIPLQKVKSQYKFVQSMRGLRSATSTKKIIEWYIKELEELNPRPEYIFDILSSLTEQQDKMKLTNVRDSADLRKAICFFEREDIVRKSDNSKASNIFDKNVDEARAIFDGERKIEDPEDSMSADKSKCHNGDFEKNLHENPDEKNTNLGANDFSRDSRNTKNEKSTKKIDETNKPGDPMEDLKKPLWASDNEKADLSDDDYEYTKEFSTKMENDFEKRRNSGKRFVDDL